MEVRGQQPGGADDARQRFKQAQSELSSANRARVRRARQVLQNLAAQRMHRQRVESRQAAESAREKGEGAIRNQATPRVDSDQIERLNKDVRADSAEFANRTEKIRHGAAAAKQDRVELSKSARILSNRADASREAHLQELKKAHQNGTLNTPERISKAAQRLLGD